MADEGEHHLHSRKLIESLVPGSMFSRYRIERLLGFGGMGIVYLAQDEKLNRPVALKILQTSNAEAGVPQGQLHREALIAASLNHPNIITVYEVGECQSLSFIAMEYVEGTSLREKLGNVRWTPRQAVELVIQLCDGLQNAHNAGIVHCDLKPGNILIRKDGLAKIVDFGISLLSSSRPDTRSAIAGTPAYMSPEQARSEPVDQRSDLFVLGIILYELLTGQRPFRGTYEAAATYAVIHLDPTPIEETLPTISPRLKSVLARLLRKDPGERYQSAEALARDLRNLLDELDDRAPLANAVTAPSLAVLPFVDMSSDHDQEYFCDGLAEELIGVLSQASGLRVVSRTSSFQYKGQNLDLRKIGADLGVNAILEGSVRKSGERLRIAAQLISVADGYHLWSDSFDRTSSDIFAIQEEIARAIAAGLRVRLGRSARRALTARHSDSPEAYNLYLKGRYFWNKRYHGGLKKGIECFRQAIELDPTYAEAYAGIADSYDILGFYNFLSPNEACSKAKAAALKALEIDPALPEALTALGWAHTFYDWDWVAARATFEQALALNPNYAITHHYFALMLVATGSIDDGIEQMRRALELDPLSPIINTSLGGILYFARRFEEAREQLKRAVEIDPQFALAHAYYAGPCLHLGEQQIAINECRLAISLADGADYTTSMLGYALGETGHTDEARIVAQSLTALAQERYVSSFHIALVYAGIGDIDETMLWLKKAITERDNWLVWLPIFPAFDKVRHDDRFARIIAEVGPPRHPGQL